MAEPHEPAFSTHPHEVVLLEGSVGLSALLRMTGAFLGSLVGVAAGAAIATHSDWRWGLGVIGVFGIGVLMFGVSLLRVGRFQLTTQRLLWRPTFAKGCREALLTSLDLASLEVDVNSATVKVGVHGSKKIVMGCVARFEELWGAILLWSDLATLAVDSKGATVSGAVATWPCAHVVRGAMPVQGTAVARPGYLAFLPGTFVVKRSRAQLAGDLVTGLGLAFVGGGIRRTPAQPPIQTTLAYGATASAEYFDALVMRMARRLGGEVLSNTSPAVTPGPKGTKLVLRTAEGRLVATLHPPPCRVGCPRHDGLVSASPPLKNLSAIRSRLRDRVRPSTYGGRS